MADNLNNGNPAPRPGRMTAVSVVACIIVVLAAGTVNAQTVPTGVQEYFILGWEQHIWDMMDRVQNGQGGAQFADGMNSVVTATASAGNQVIYYDHWEDTYDAELDNFPNVDPALLQASTLVIGDGDASNGDVCTFNANIACGTDVLTAGDYVNFNSDRGLGGGCTTPGTPERCSVPLNPRSSTDIRFDGGDLMKTSGGPLTVIHSQYPLTNFIGGSTEILSRQAVEAARSYSVPIGEDLYVANTVTEPFHYVELELVAFADTSITVDSPGAGSVSFILSRGEHWSSMGFIDDVAFPALGLTINAGTKVSTTAPISGMIFTGGDGTWATRHYALLPDILHSTDYVTTAPGDNPTAGPTTNGTPQNRPANVYLLNPDLLTSIDVTITDSSGTYVVTIPANSMRSMDDIGAGRDIAANSTVRMYSDRNFWGVTAYDYNTNISDWGHSWLAKKFLTNTYTVSFGPGNQNQPPDNSQYANPVFMAATADRTRVQFDLDNDGTFDQVDLDGDGTADAAPYANNTYEVNILAALKVIDPTDNDMTGARIIANKPVAVSWGQDTDRSYYSDQALDTGFTIYPINQLFLDPALTIDKEVDTTVVPTASVDPADRTVTYTLTVKSYEFGPLSNVEVFDLLPTGVFGETDYLPGSTLITCPNLAQGTADPAFDDCTGGIQCGRLTWDIEGACGAGFTLNPNNTLTVRYDVVIPAAPGGTPRQLTNEGHAQATLGGSVFSPSDTAKVVQTDVTLDKSVDVSTPAAGDVLTFTLQVANTSTSINETQVFISDPIPPDTTFEPGSITADGVFAGSGVFDAAQNAVVWNAALFPFGASATLSFQVRVNPTVPAGTEIPNRGGYESFETPYFLSNEVQPVVQGPALTVSKSIVNNPPVVHPNEIVAFDILVDNSGTAAANNVVIVDPFPANATYVAESMEWSLNSGPFAPLTDANDGDEGGGADGRAFVDRVELRFATLGPTQDITLRFRVTVDTGPPGRFVSNQATVASDEVPGTDTNLVQVPIVGDANITGHVFIDTDGNGTQDPGEPDLANIDVLIVDAMGNPQIVSTDANGDWLATVEFGPATVDVDETDSDFPPGAILSTANDPQPVVAVSGATVPTGDVGYTPLPLSFFKTSDAGGEVFPGDTITYTIRATNYTAVNQTNVVINDPLPAGTLAVPGSTQVTVSDPVFRVREYYIAPGPFTDLVYDLTLGDDLAQDYFVMVQGAAGPNDRDPEADYARLTQHPFTPAQVPGDLAQSGGTNVIRIERRDTADEWSGVVTVVECLSNCDTAGFRLRSVDSVLHNGTDETGNDTAAASWTDINQVLLMGGFNGAGCYSDETTDRDHPVCHARLYPSGSDQINWTRDGSNGSVNLTAATSTVMAIEWGSEWTVQRVNVTGSNGGDGLDATGEYNTAGISAVARANTWVWGTGHADGNGIGNQAEGVLIALGNGVAQNATESLVAIGTEIDGTALDFEVWTLTHPSLSVEHLFKVDGDSGATVVDLAATAAGTERMALVTNGQDGTTDDYSRPILSARYFNPALIRLERHRSGSEFPALAQGIDFSSVAGGSTFTGGDPAALVTVADAVTLVPLGTITVTFQVTVDPDIAPAITQIVNTATITTDQEGPFDSSVTDDVVRVSVVVEYDNAGFGPLGDTVTYYHEVINTGLSDDSYEITLDSELDWLVELIDPSTGAVIATDSSGDGDSLWDGGVTINTGTLAPGESAEYEIRVTVPAGGPVGAEESTSLIATSDRRPSTWAIATDETVAVAALDPVIFLPDNSGVAPAGGTEAYGHRIINNTGVTDTFDLQGWSENGWDFTFHWDANGDGVFTPGVDVEITNTLQLADGASQLIFLVTDVPGGTPDGTVDVVHLGAESRNNVCDPVTELCDPYLFGSATDTTTVAPPTELDLSGGGTRSVSPGDVAVFPGTLRNLTETDDIYDFEISAAWFWGFDGLDHPTELWIDTNGDGDPDTQIAEDLEGDGTWDDDNGFSLTPSAGVSADTILAYELRRPVDLLQGTSRDPVTLTALPQVANDEDSITATVLVAAATAAVLAEFDAYSVNSQVVVEWRTSAEVGTVGFELWRWKSGERDYQRAITSLVPGLRHHLQGGTYRVVDRGASVGESLYYVLHERDVWGTGRTFGPFEVKIEERESSTKVAQALAVGMSRTPNRSSVRVAVSKSSSIVGEPSGLVKVKVRERGLVWVSAEELATALGTDPTTVSGWIASGNLWIADSSGQAITTDLIFADGFESGNDDNWGGIPANQPNDQHGVAWVGAADNIGIFFFGESIDNIYTADNVYWLGVGSGTTMARRSAWTNAEPSVQGFDETLHFEEDSWPLTAVMTDSEADYWMWDFFFPWQSEPPGNGEPVVSKSFVLTTPGLDPAGVNATLTVNLQGSYIAPEVSPNHQVDVQLNGVPLSGTWSWDGHDVLNLELVFPQSLLVDGDNTVELTARLVDGAWFDEFYLDSFDLGYRRSYRAHEDRLLAVGGGDYEITVAGFTSPDILVVDLTDPLQPVMFDPVNVRPDGDSYMVTFTTGGTALPFLATTLAGLQPAAGVVTDLASSLSAPGNRGQWVVVAGPGLEGEAAILAAHRSQQGLSSVVARVADIYDEFNDGVKSPWAIHDFLRHAAENWEKPPEYVFLAGDGSLDHKGVWGNGEDLVPALMAVTADGLVPSDNLLADWLGDDGLPEVAIGRLPAQSAAELAIYRDKVIAFEASSGDWKRRALWLADAADEGGEFPEDLQQLVNGMPTTYTSEKIVVDWLGADEARQRALQSWDDGAVLVQFLGHGALDFIANHGLITTDDVGTMTNGERTPFLAALTCMVGRFDIPDYDILSEALLLKDAGGSIGVWSPSAFSMNEDAALLGIYQVEAIASGEYATIGDSVRAALEAYVASGTGSPDLSRIFIFLGDPAVRVDW